MLAALCAWFGVLCGAANADLPPRTAAPAMAVPAAISPSLAVPDTSRGEPSPPQFFDPNCDVQPPLELAKHYAAAARRYPEGADECSLAKQGFAECSECWRTGNYAIEGATGDVGVGQFQPATAAELGIDPTDPRESIFGQAKYLLWCQKRWTPGLGGRTEADIRALRLATYNRGFGNMRKSQAEFGWTRWLQAKPHQPPVTIHYVAKIEGL